MSRGLEEKAKIEFREATHLLVNCDITEINLRNASTQEKNEQISKREGEYIGVLSHDGFYYGKVRLLKHRPDKDLYFELYPADDFKGNPRRSYSLMQGILEIKPTFS